ncbi:MAG: ABC transporter substrate-binding protein [Acidimicrobiia bacterium]|nr:ABC transporter substrate-binding protein [Acidimicrobiia bacterium]
MSGTRRGRITALVAVVAIGAATLSAVAAPAGADRQARAQHATKPKSGGSVQFGLEAETNGGFCLPDSTLAASGIQVVSAIYDTLVTLNAKGEYVPYLAKSVEPNADFTQWTITLRPDVQFHDGTPFDSEALKLNLDTYRGQNPNIKPRLSVFVWQNVASVEVTGPLSVVVTTKVPWVAFPALLSGSGRTGMVGPAQLVDRETCATNMIGTGPFKLVDWRPNESLTVAKNTKYWQEGLPYLDEIVFQPLTESQSRVIGLQSGDLDLITTGNSQSILDLKQSAKAGDNKVIVSDNGAETGYLMLNVSKPPFDDPIARQAVAAGGDARESNRIRNKGLNTIATGPFPPDNPAYVKNNTRIHSVARAKKLNAEYEQKHGQPISFEYLTNPDPETIALAALFKEQEKQAGIDVSIRTVDQATQINEAIAGSFQGVAFRNHPGGDPDTNYVWWHSGSPTNFGRINDPEIDRLLDEGRSEPDAAKRVAIYRELNKLFGKELYNLWAWYTLWAVGYQNNVKGVAGPPLPDGGGRPFSLFAGVIPVLGISKT